MKLDDGLVLKERRRPMQEWELFRRLEASAPCCCVGSTWMKMYWSQSVLFNRFGCANTVTCPLGKMSSRSTRIVISYTIREHRTSYSPNLYRSRFPWQRDLQRETSVYGRLFRVGTGVNRVRVGATAAQHGESSKPSSTCSTSAALAKVVWRP